MDQPNRLSDTERKRLNDISRDVIGAAIRVHSVLGSGLLENAYEACLEHELRQRGHRVLRQVALPVTFDGLKVDLGYRIDMIVDDSVILELKACEAIAPVHPFPAYILFKTQQKPFGTVDQLPRIQP